ncbi:16S rRNA (uracil(1498)-N(3))-methyltransferase [Salinispora arenicola]|uniref:Ribosomal RNA small subunit methyltransferase E n=1 Tax=Salinispora arenicola TaxID=168697 RepID=A0A542XNT6_SALAC|nr:16S rRNA (uracil(1498)-N(3))-methyltransferase [Salinispora arenicola]MCN0150506.1 16S rRNA (uracil(1498)-N(3))-methyltransferase [Salinispora arenicola]NIL43442.1 16S rRNA (uracil(1498)-N(3))-methyltransferase [Salinispora arenicola]TQL37495.1 16S rRNA (uracil1498-N3)-methyltransferase [Salinispora arenicola]GIM86940.1 ribosomal RNA small subunit methyltransferase E [Salinispora arenicola]
MSAPLFLVESLPTADTAILEGAEGHHAATVQRLRVGEELLLADGRGGTAAAVVTAVGKGVLDVRITSRGYTDAPVHRLVVVQGLAKGERGELAVQAMTEVGVDEIVPWTAARSVTQWRGDRGVRAREKWVATVREATKQARRAWLPVVAGTPDEATSQVAGRIAGAAAAYVLHEQAEKRLVTAELPDGGEIVLVVGPEGGLAPDELTAFVAAGAQTVRLGPSVLRTSTAGVAALSVLAARLGRW